MALRPTMAALITRVQSLVADPAGTIYPAQTVQDELDRTRWDMRSGDFILTGVRTVTPALVTWHEYWAVIQGTTYGDWEDTVQLQTGMFYPLTPDVSNLLLGQWLFTASTPPPVRMASGTTYDCYLTAATLLRQRAAGMMGLVDFSEDGQSIKASQRRSGYLAQASAYEALARPRSSNLISGARA